MSTTNELHHTQAKAALNAGKHVLCEKPLALSLSDAWEMVKLAGEKKLVFGTNHHLRNAITHAPASLEVHGTEGSLFGYGIMTQKPTGDLYLQRGTERTNVDLGKREGLYEHAVRHFNQAVKGSGGPFATGVDGVKSLAVALAAKASAACGKRVRVEEIS
ncbi:MAG TPA: Gfo/Idh/MocA family oxidoreductase [Chthoniobacterales bacterium]